MHRSGTSATTGALGALGFQPPAHQDRMNWHESNPEHWESMSLSAFNDSLLRDLGGSWDAPPQLDPGWEAASSFAHLGDPAIAAERAFPYAAPLVWKDPRLCLILPFWRRILPEPLATVFIWRSPHEVATSLHRRDGLHLAEGIALWERYNLSAIRNVIGLSTFVCRYESLVGDPIRTLTSIADWLASLPQFTRAAPSWDLPGACRMITGERRSTARTDDDLLLPQQSDLCTLLESMQGGHQCVPPIPIMRESEWTMALLEARRIGWARETTKVADIQSELDRLRTSTSWRVTAPMRAAVARARAWIG